MLAETAGFIWDIDGVVMDSPQEEAWRLVVMEEPWNADGLSSDFYFAHLASRPRHEGADSILRLKGIYERLGATTEAERRKLADELATEKDALTRDLVERGEFRLFVDAVNLLLRAKQRGIAQAAASASKNARTMLMNVSRSRVLRELGQDFGAMADGDSLYSVFDFDACGVEAGGKAGILRFAAEGLASASGGKITRFAVFEDAPSGMAAAKSLGFCAVGALRIGTHEALTGAGAEMVTADLSALTVDNILEVMG
jgi:beta-phosphoglucomutase